MASVEFRGVRKVYDKGFVAVDSLDLAVADKEFLVLVGPSGCGKSTTLRMLAGLESISGGELLIDGSVVNETPPKDRDIAMVFQNYALYPHMTVEENMSFGLRLRKIDRETIRKRVEEAAGILEIQPLLDRRPKELSGGQRQRVALGRAIVRKPKVFLFDEPLSNLDAKLRVQMRTEISKLHQRLGTTVVYVTHDQVEAMTMGERIVVMKDGRAMQVDTPLNLYKNPAHRFVAGFVGSPSMNLLDGNLNEGMFRCGSFAVRIGGLANDSPGPATLGIRPEDIRLSPREGDVQLPSRVELVEPMGAETFLHCSVEDREIVVRTPGIPKLGPGDVVSLAIDPAEAHTFDAETGERLV